MIEFCDVSFRYGETNQTGGIHHINLTVKDGECVLLCGESGCGKTTLTRLLNGLIPHFYSGRLSGEVRIHGKDISQMQLYELAPLVGSVFQNPRSQFFNVDTDSELAFSCENLGYSIPDIHKRVNKTVDELHLHHLLGRNIFHLSGGQQQIISCGTVNTQGADIIVLDEPSSNLDAAATEHLRQVIMRWKKQGKTILIAEHRLYYLADFVDRIVYMKDGTICKEMTYDELTAMPQDKRCRLGLRASNLSHLTFSSLCRTPIQESLMLEDFCFSYRHTGRALHIPNLTLPAGQIIAITGLNGAGKSTFARCLCGLQKRCGLLHLGNQSLNWRKRLKSCYMVMQDTGRQLFTEYVLDEVLLSMDCEDEETALHILDRLDLRLYKDRHPQSLSGGQKQRLAIASALAGERDILVFDEPTSGLDYRHMTEVATCLKELMQKGKTIFVITHDAELILSCCTHIMHMECGEITASYPLNETGTKKVLDFFLHPIKERSYYETTQNEWTKKPVSIRGQA
ncbi:MAG: energy-coupling factor ABC transporter ATP-binding protein [Eubacterium sp.]|nr:energy-coupling factor ABC transporter ATP-binding protein [Eubacterium sp.]